MKMKLYSLFIILFLSSCTGLHKIYQRDHDNGKQIISIGYFRGITYLAVDSKKKRKLEYNLRFDCECEYWKQGLCKIYDNSFWKAVTDTIKGPTFYEDKLNVSSLVIPLVFLPIKNEEIELLNIGIEKSKENCCYSEAKPLGEIIGYVKTNLSVSKK